MKPQTRGKAASWGDFLAFFSGEERAWFLAPLAFRQLFTSACWLRVPVRGGTPQRTRCGAGWSSCFRRHAAGQLVGKGSSPYRIACAVEYRHELEHKANTRTQIAASTPVEPRTKPAPPAITRSGGLAWKVPAGVKADFSPEGDRSKNQQSFPGKRIIMSIQLSKRAFSSRTSCTRGGGGVLQPPGPLRDRGVCFFYLTRNAVLLIPAGLLFKTAPYFLLPRHCCPKTAETWMEPRTHTCMHLCLR